MLSSDFKVHGVQGLRVVDASVFPRIPGYFIASAIYMIGEKAADVIAAAAAGTAPAPGPVHPPRTRDLNIVARTAAVPAGPGARGRS